MYEIFRLTGMTTATTAPYSGVRLYNSVMNHPLQWYCDTAVQSITTSIITKRFIHSQSVVVSNNRRTETRSSVVSQLLIAAGI